MTPKSKYKANSYIIMTVCSMFLSSHKNRSGSLKRKKTQADRQVLPQLFEDFLNVHESFY